MSKCYQNLVVANKETAEELLPVKTRSKRWIIANDTHVQEARKKVNVAFNDYEKRQSQENEAILQSEKANLKRMYEQAFEKDLEEKVKKVEDADSRAQHGLSWRLINEISGRKATPKGTIKGKSCEERVKSWYNHFSKLLGAEPAISDYVEEMSTVFEELDMETGPFTMDEYQKVKRSLKTGKAAGEDGIPPEVLKYCHLDEIILTYANKLIVNGIKPQQWSDINLLPIPKTGNLSLTGNYRGIGLSSVVAKLVNKMLLNRIQPVLDPLLRPNQNGFRPGRSTNAHIIKGVYLQNSGN